ncbi:HNH endonuclease [Bacillus wiedmannii]|uniref:HNH endonuclease n=1 Tax=Bacillus wiedmannii TaxID=1890302 RepID=UPI000BF282B5|nr:hypothetical protein [Bacillus wiedmannii]PGB70722.1 hypothetical protein COM12_04970 [Bacillus wiedmannii]
MPSNYGVSETPNIAIKRYLTVIGKHYLESFPKDTVTKFNNGQLWNEIKEEFGYRCAYCGRKQGDLITVVEKKKETEKKLVLEREHIFMMNQDDVGLHHPGNIIPSCKPCNQARRKKTWKEYLEEICKGDADVFQSRKEKILEQIEKYKYSEITEKEFSKIRDMAKELYREIAKLTEDKSQEVIKDLDSCR